MSEVAERKCLNCNQSLENEAAFCSKCGQKVDKNNLTLKAVATEFFENFISLDSRFGRSIKPFLLKPGFLSQQFINGVRKDYANPFRLYIFTSILFFFSLNFAFKNKDLDIVKVNNTTLYEFNDLERQEYEQLNEKLPSYIRSQLNSTQETTFSSSFKKLHPAIQRSILDELDQNMIDEYELKINNNSKVQALKEDLSYRQWKIEKYYDDPEFTNDQLYDSLQLENPTIFEELFARQSIKLQRTDEAYFNSYILKNLSFAMFFLLPLFALILFFVYRKRNAYYIAHLIHTIYLQSFMFILLGLALLIMGFIDAGKPMARLVALSTLIVFAIYFFQSLKYLYQEGFFKRLFKTIFLRFSYFILLMVTFLGEVIVSFILF